MLTRKFMYTLDVICESSAYALFLVYLSQGNRGMALWTLALGVVMVFISYQNAKGITNATN